MHGADDAFDPPRLTVRERRGAFVPLTPLVDVMLILLVFFMVTSTYLDLDMIPVAGTDAVEETPDPDTTRPSSTQKTQAEALPGTILLRLAGDGRVRFRGRNQTLPEIAAALTGILRTRPEAQVLILPSAQATSQALVSLLETTTTVGVQNVRIVRLEAVQ